MLAMHTKILLPELCLKTFRQTIPAHFAIHLQGNLSPLSDHHLKQKSKKKKLSERKKVRVIGVEPTRLAASDPKSDASANFATPALKTRTVIWERKCRSFCEINKK